MSTADDWLYNDDLDIGVSERDHLVSPVSRDGEDLLDAVLTAPSNSMRMNHDPADEDDMLDMDNIKSETAAMEDSGSARFNADQVAKKAQMRMEAIAMNGGRGIYSREPNRKNSIFIGNLTWWTSDEDLIVAVREAGLKDVICIKFYETRANGQSKGFALVELSSESVATNAQAKLETLTIHNQKPIVSYAFRISPHQFEGKCNTAKGGVSASSSNTSIGSGSSYNSIRRPTNTPSLQISNPVPPLGIPPGFPPPSLPGLRPPGMLGPDGNGLGLMGAAPPLPPPNMLPVMPPGMPPGFPPLNIMGRPPMMPGMPPVPHGILGGALDQIKAAGNAPHLNPAFLQEMAAQNAQQGSMQKMAELFDRFRQQTVPGPHMGGGMVDNRRGQHQHLSEEEITDTNQRNKAISSSAINRALSDANAGDYESAADMLRMACSLIKQSVTYNSETSQILIQSLQDCLHGIEEQATVTRRSSSRREHHSHDDRERSRSTHRSAKHHRDRSRERRR